MQNALKTVAVAAAIATAGFAAQAQEAQRAITHVDGDVYRVQSNFHFSLAVETDDGIVVIDPINADAAGWLKDNVSEIAGKPITHLIYSHSHGDHASGGAVFDGAVAIAHANAPDAIDGVRPAVRFSDELTMEIGGKSFEMTYLGPGHGVDLIAVVVRPENVGFVVDAAAPRRLPFRDMRGANIDDWINQVRKTETLDFEIFAPGHGVVGVHADAADARVYMQELRAEVLAGLKAGKSADELAESVTMDAYKDWIAYSQFREENVRGMARFLTESGQVN